MIKIQDFDLIRPRNNGTEITMEVLVTVLSRLRISISIGIELGNLQPSQGIAKPIPLINPVEVTSILKLPHLTSV